MHIQHERTDNRGAFFVEQDGKRVAEMTYVMAGNDRMIIDHTEVGDELRGQGAGKQLVLAAVDMAREQKIRIMPLCPFAKSVFDRTPEIRDVL